AAMAAAGWAWAPLMQMVLAHRPDIGRDREVWDALPAWADEMPPPPPGTAPPTPADVTTRLAELVGLGAEDRPTQRGYALTVAGAFAPPLNADAPVAVLAEAGTGIGKTLGYVA